MPSLRRSVSESASTSRASPYPTSLSLSAAGALNAGVPIRPRRVLSETSRRRPLADIEWWRILDGQQEENDAANENIPDHVAELQDGLAEAMQDTPAAAIVPDAAAVVDSADDASAAVVSPGASQGASSLTTPFAALSISSSVPIMPPMTPPRSRNASDSSSGSSVVSTPDSSPRTPPALRHEMLFMMDSSGFDCTSTNDDEDDWEFFTPLPPFLTVRGGGSNSLHGLAMMRTATFGGFDAHREAPDERFGDVIFV